MARNAGGALKQQAGGAVREAGPLVERLARLGYAAKGVVYFLVGMLALQAAVGLGGKTTDTRGALHTIAGDEAGRFVLALLAIGLAGYALWRLVQALFDPERKAAGEGIKGVLMRVGLVISGLAYTSLSLTAFRLVTGMRGGGDGGGGTETATRTALSQPFGQFLVIAAGIVVIGLAGYQAYKGIKEKFKQELDLAAMPPAEEKAATVTGKVGLIARGVVLALVGWFLLRAGFASDAAQARGLDGALLSLAQQPYGQVLLGIVALGLIAYGAYCLIQARWRHVPQPSV